MPLEPSVNRTLHDCVTCEAFRPKDTTVRAGVILLALLAPLTAEETVRGVMQATPGGRAALIDAHVRPTPANLPFFEADHVILSNRDLVLGVSQGDNHWAVPIRFLGLFEVLNIRLGELPVAATW